MVEVVVDLGEVKGKMEDADDECWCKRQEAEARMGIVLCLLSEASASTVVSARREWND